MKKIIIFEKSALKEICKALNIPCHKDIVAFTKEGVIRKRKDIFDIIKLADELDK